MEFPPDDVALALAPPELAGYMLTRALLTTWRYEEKAFSYKSCLPPQTQNNPELRLAYAEAWNWLLREGLLLPDQNPWLVGQSSSVVPSRFARTLTDRSAFEAMRHSKLLPRHLLDERIRLKVETHFVQGHYDEGVTLAMREVEIALRAATGASAEDYSTDLIKLAFHPKDGKLTDQTSMYSEQESLHMLFRGAYGLYRNPTSHRVVGLGPEMAVEIFLLASHLLRIIARSQTPLTAKA